jgi:hypothetical protein
MCRRRSAYASTELKHSDLGRATLSGHNQNMTVIEANGQLPPTSHLLWVRFELDLLLSSRHLWPMSSSETARYDELCSLEIELLG